MTQQSYLQFYRDSQAESYFDAKNDGSLRELPVADISHLNDLYIAVEVASDMMEHEAKINYFYKTANGLHPIAFITDKEIEAVLSINLFGQYDMPEDMREAFEVLGYWEHPFYDRKAWKEEVANDCTISSYWDWAYARLDEQESQA